MPESHERWSPVVATGALVAIPVAWLAAVVQVQWAPLLLFPVLTGVVFGGGLWLLLRGGTKRAGGSILAAALIGGLVLVGGQHYFAFRQYRAHVERSRSKDPQAQLAELAFRDRQPKSFGEFLSYSARERVLGGYNLHGWKVWLSWGVDALLTLAGAAGVVWFARIKEDAAKPQAAGG